MTEKDIVSRIRHKLTYAPAINARVKFDLADDGVFILDGTVSPATLEARDGSADTILKCSIDTLAGILSGTIDPNFAFMTGKLKIEGSIGVAMKLNAILEE